MTKTMTKTMTINLTLTMNRTKPHGKNIPGLLIKTSLLSVLVLAGMQIMAQTRAQARTQARTQSASRSNSTTLQYINAQHLLLQGRAASIPSQGYNRIDTNLLKKIPSHVAGLSKNTAGLQVDFITNSTTIAFKWTLEKYSLLPNMTPIAKNGLDLYGFNHNRLQFVATAAPTGAHSEKIAVSHLDGQMRHYRVYLPLYGSLTELFVGIDSGAVIQTPKLVRQPKIVIYGTSITQGASASRPGLAYPAILSRHLNATVYNMGFSGSGKMEPEMAPVIGHMPADLYILDCVPNMTASLLQQRVVPFVHLLRQLKPATPILILESPIRETSYWNQEVQKSMAAQNQAIHEAYLRLQKEGLKNIYYQDASGFTGFDHEATIDGTHLTDLGFKRLTTILEKKIKAILPALFSK